MSRDASLLAVLATAAALALVPSRDVAITAVVAVLLLARAALGYGYGRQLVLACGLALLVSPVLREPTPVVWRTAVLVGGSASLMLGAWLAVRAFVPAGKKSVALVALSPLVSAWLAWIVPNTHSGWIGANTFIDYTLATGMLNFAIGAFLREPVVLALGSLSLATCLFHGWPLVVFVLFEALALSGEPLPAHGRIARSDLVAPCLWLALLTGVSGGYGFSRIDLSLMSLGWYNQYEVSVVWAGLVVVLAYAWVILLALRVTQRLAPGDVGRALAALLGVHLLFAGGDLFGLSSGLEHSRAARFEERLAFDVCLGLVVCGIAGVTLAGRRLQRRAAERAAAQAVLAAAVGAVGAVATTPAARDRRADEVMTVSPVACVPLETEEEPTVVG